MSRELLCESCQRPRHIGDVDGQGAVTVQCAGCREWHRYEFDTRQLAPNLHDSEPSATLKAERQS
jgi:hypothetical protein